MPVLLTDMVSTFESGLSMLFIGTVSTFESNLSILLTESATVVWILDRILKGRLLKLFTECLFLYVSGIKYVKI